MTSDGYEHRPSRLERTRAGKKWYCCRCFEDVLRREMREENDAIVLATDPNATTTQRSYIMNRITRKDRSNPSGQPGKN